MIIRLDPVAFHVQMSYVFTDYPYLTNGFSNRYQLGESTFIFRGVRSDFYSHYLMKFLCANRIAPDGTPRSAASTSGAILFASVPKKGRQAYIS